MRKLILVVLSVVLVLSSFTACGKKKENYEESDESRVLYNDSGELQSGDDTSGNSVEDTQSENVSLDTDKSAKDSDSKNESADSKSQSDSSSRKTTIIKSTANSSSSAVSSNASSAAAVTQSQRSASASSRTVSAASVSSAAAISSSVSSNDINTDSEEGTDTEWFDSDIQDTDTEEVNTDTEVEDDTDSEIEKGSLEEADLSFPVSGGALYVGQDFETADSILGGFNTEAEISGGKTYSYNECTITTYIDDDDEEYISNITVSSPNYTISKNIGVGSSTDDLLMAFGDAEYGYTYTWGSRMLEFVVSGDVVTEIIFS